MYKYQIQYNGIFCVFRKRKSKKNIRNTYTEKKIDDKFSSIVLHWIDDKFHQFNEKFLQFEDCVFLHLFQLHWIDDFFYINLNQLFFFELMTNFINSMKSFFNLRIVRFFTFSSFIELKIFFTSFWWKFKHTIPISK